MYQGYRRQFVELALESIAVALVKSLISGEDMRSDRMERHVGRLL